MGFAGGNFQDNNTDEEVLALSTYPDQKLLLNACGSFSDGTNVGLYNAGHVQDNSMWVVFYQHYS